MADKQCRNGALAYGSSAVCDHPCAASGRGRKTARPSGWPGTCCKCAGNRNTLLLTPGQLVGIGVRARLQPETGKPAAALAVGVVSRQPFSPKRDILKGGHVRKQRKILEDQACTPLPRAARSGPGERSAVRSEPRLHRQAPARQAGAAGSICQPRKANQREDRPGSRVRLALETIAVPHRCARHPRAIKAVIRHGQLPGRARDRRRDR